MKIAVAQIACTLGDVPANLRKIEDFAKRAKAAGSELILFPEMVDTGYAMGIIRRHASRWDEGAVPQLQKIAQRLSIRIICGVSEREDSLIYNSQVAIDADGQIHAKYRKTHLFTAAPIEEDKCFSHGGKLATLALDGFRLGLSICYDLRFPEVYRQIATNREADVFIISSAWPFPRVEHLRILATARAIENQSYVVLANRVGTDDGVTFCGSSAIIDPSGIVMAGASPDREELLQAEITQDVLNAVRSRMPVFAHRRPELYG